MKPSVFRKTAKVYPDPSRVVARFFSNDYERNRHIIKRVLKLDEAQAGIVINQVLREFSRRHRNITRIFERHCENLKPDFEYLGIDYNAVSLKHRLLIGSYFTMEYSIEAAAIFNPSMIEDMDQSGLEADQKRVIISFRAVGEAHISSLVFRRAIIDANNDIHLVEKSTYIDEPEVYRNAVYTKHTFFQKAASIHLPKEVLKGILVQLEDEFEYLALKDAIHNLQKKYAGQPILIQDLERVLWLAYSYYDIHFSLDTDISDRVIFPYSEAEKAGIEDARFVRFTDDDGRFIFYATYTAFDGKNIQPMLLETTDFYHFKIMPLYGAGAQNKNLALFPRKIKGKYVMISRIDGINNYIMYSDNINVWENPIKLQEPASPWEFIQVGNCGSPIETDKGWLLITHRVGPMRRYSLSAALFDLEDPGREIGRLNYPLLMPSEKEREGYVPNVVYSCGSIIHNGELILPYGMSDFASSFASVPLDQLLNALLEDKKIDGQ